MEKILRKFIIVLITFIAVIIQSREASASHAMGADLTYECLGGNTYRLRVSFYRDCIGINAPNNVYVSIQSISCNQNLGITCQPVSGTGQEVSPLCATAVSSCNGGPFTGIQEWIYEGIVTLPMQCTDWVFSYNLCCRNAAITNITNPASNTFYIYATLNNTISPCNSSPTFSNKPVPFACIGQEYCFNHGAYDPDGDSLVYSLIDPYQSATTTVTYNGAFTATNPLSSSPPMTFNTATGDVCMTPTNIEITVMAVLVSEYRNGVLIGTVERDIQVTVLNCNNTLPTLSGINGTGNFSASVCAGQQLCFNINSADPDASQNVTVTWDNSIPGATFTTTAGPRPTGTFCWTPSVNDISNNPYCFTVRVSDDACPMVGAQVYSYCITVQGVNVNAGPDQLIACNALATITASATLGTGNYTYQWNNGVTTPSQNVGPGTYIVTVNDGICSYQDTVQVSNAFVPVAGFAASGTCPNTPVQFTDQTVLTGGVITSWTWNFAGLGTSGQQNPVFSFPGPGSYSVSLIIQTNLGCSDTIVQPVVIASPPVAAFSGGPVCANTPLTFNNTTSPAGSYLWNWNFGNGQTSGLQNPSVTYATAGSYTVMLIATDSTGCTDTLTQQIGIYPLPVPAFSTTSLLCQGGSIVFNNTSTSGGGSITGYSWNFGNGQTSTALNPTVAFAAPGNYNVSLTVNNSLGCSATLIQNIGINPPPVASAGSNQAICIGYSATLTASGGTSYVWLPGGQTTNPITVTPMVNSNYSVIVTNSNGCKDTATVQVTVNPLPQIGVTPSSAICQGQSTTLTATGGTSYSWSPTGDLTGSIVVTPTASTTYAVTGSNVNGCSSTAFVTVTVNPLPVVNVSNVFICQGSSSTMSASTIGVSYLWSTGAVSQIINVVNPGTYTVTVTNSLGCSASASAIASMSGTLVNTLQNSSFCVGGSVVLDAGNPGNNYQWSTGATTQTITVNNPGAYSVTITDNNGCSGILSSTVNVNPLPDANFIPSDICISQPLQFSDISTISTGNIVSWAWNFGDGNISQQQDPIHNFASPGTYNVTLLVTSNMGCVDSIIRPFTVYPLPQANFAYNFACENEPIQFTDMSFTQMGNIIGWYWDFNDGTTSFQQNPIHGFPTAGTYNVTLTVTTTGGCSDTRIRNINIYPGPTLSFISTPSATCLGTSMTITNTSSSSNGAITSWFWDFGDGTISTVANPTHTYAAPGTYTLTLIGETSHGCRDTITETYTVYPLPLADAGADQSVCAGTSAILTATGGASYLWSNGSTQQTTVVTPAMATTYYVLVTSANGCTAIDSVRVFPRPYPYVNAGPDRAVCAGQSVTLTGNYTSGHIWQPGGQTTQSITVNPVTTTNYTYSYTTVFGCSSTDTVRVIVNPLPVANAGPDQMICNGATTLLSASGGNSYIWYPVGGTSSNLVIAPTVPTVYSVLVTDANGCTDFDSVSVGINPTPSVSLPPTFFCLGTTTTLNAGNPGSTYLWSPGGETTQSIVVMDSGFYQVVVTNAFGCIGVAATNVTQGGTGIQPNPVNENICAGQSILLDAANPGATYLWSNGATSQTITVSSSGTYSVTVTDNSGCSASFASNVIVNPVPVLQFIVTPACTDENAMFVNSSTISSGNIISWSWNFGDGGVSNLFQPTHTYPTTGTYTVTLQAQSGMGCSTTLVQQIGIDPQPLADFTASTVCDGQQTIFQDQSVVLNGSISSWSWNFGDGSTGFVQHPVHTYSTPGLYNVSLIVFTPSGCSDTIVNQVTVLDVPIPDFTAQNVCNGTAMQFIENSQMNGIIAGYQWNFGDGNVSIAQNPAHIYAAAGTYNVTLSVISDVGCSADITRQVIVYPSPVAAASVSPVCDGIAANFMNTSAIGSGSIVNTYWNFGDGGSSNSITPSHLYNATGTYNILLVVTSNHNCTDSLSLQAIVHPMPVSAFTAANVCLGNQVQFTDQSSISGGTITAWSWNFGDAAQSNIASPSHNYNSSGTYNVIHAVTSNYGCTDSVSSSVNVYAEPVAAFAGSNVCYGDVSTFFNQSTLTGGGALQCTWNFGDGATSATMHPQHTYQNPGTYTVTLTVNSTYGCSDSVTQQVVIYASPVADFTAINACDGAPVNFIDQSSSSSGPVNAWNWNFGDGGTSASASPFHSYLLPGNYLVSLTVTSLYGCSGTTSDTVSSFGLPVPVITAIANCEYDPVTFTSISAIGDTATYQYNWNFGDGTTSVSDDPVHLYAAPGVYTITLTMINANGCTATASTVVDLAPAPDADFNYADGCAESGMQFTNTSTISSGNIVSYIWNFGDGSPSSSTINPIHTFNASGTYSVMLIAISDNGCVDTLIQQINIFPLPVPNFSYSQAAGCGPLTVNFSDASYVTSGSIVNWSWDFGNGSTSSAQHPTTVYNYSGTYGVSLTVTTNLGCMQTFTQPNIITVYPGPTANFAADPYQTTTLDPVFNFNNLSTGGSVYSWTFGDGGTSTMFEPTHAYQDTGTYHVHLLVQNTYGCIDTITRIVKVIPEFTVYIPNAFTPNNDGVNDQFTVVGLGIKGVVINVFNRWGENVYTTSDMHTGWNGTIQKNSNEAQQDVYVYDVEVLDVFGIKHYMSGRVTLIR